MEPDLTEGGKKPEKRVNRRKNDFLQRLSCVMIVCASIGGLLVLIDPQVTYIFEDGTMIKLGSDGIGDGLKGAVVNSMMIAGLTVVLQFWFGSSKSGQDQADAVQKIAESVPVAAATAAAATGTPAATAPIVTPGPTMLDGTVPAAEVVKDPKA